MVEFICLDTTFAKYLKMIDFLYRLDPNADDVYSAWFFDLAGTYKKK